jgi:hypothetical protein
LLWLGYWIKGQSLVPGTGISEKGQFGDMFGALNAFFSALAFTALIFTVFLQINQTREQQQELKRAEELQRQSAEALRQQAEANELSAKLAALNSLIQAISRQLEHVKDKQQEHFLKMDLDAAIGDLRNLIRTKEVFAESPDLSINDAPLTADIVTEMFPTHINYFSREDIQSRASELCSRLVRSGVDSRGKLRAVLSSRQVIRKLERLYVEELKRPPIRPLDPDAVAVWGVRLLADSSQAQADTIEKNLRESREAREKNQFSFPALFIKDLDLSYQPHAPVILVLPNEEVSSRANFVYARELALRWMNGHKDSKKPRIYCFDFDRKQWQEEENWESLDFNR